jgi:hypothetical protein
VVLFTAKIKDIVFIPERELNLRVMLVNFNPGERISRLVLRKI